MNTSLTLDEAAIALRCHDQTVAQMNYSAISQVLIEEGTGAAVIRSDAASFCLGSKNSKISSFYTAGIEKVVEKIRQKVPGKISTVPSLKEEMKRLAIKPFI